MVIKRRSAEYRELEGRLDFRRAVLRRAYLSGAHLEGAFLQRAHLERARLTGAHLEGATKGQGRALLEGKAHFMLRCDIAYVENARPVSREPGGLHFRADERREARGLVTTKSRGKEPLVFSRTEQRAIVTEALGILPNFLRVYRCLGKRIGVSYGTIWNIAKDEGIKLIRVDRRRLAKGGPRPAIRARRIPVTSLAADRRNAADSRCCRTSRGVFRALMIARC